MSTFETRDPSELKRHPKNKEIYGELTLEPDFRASIEGEGVLEPVVITPDDTIVSGHRRIKAAKEVGLDKVPVRVKEFDSELEKRAQIVHSNKNRTKTFSQKMREALELEDIEQERAKQRQGDRTDVTQNFASSEYGESREKVAENFGVSRETYRKAKKVWKAAQDGVRRLEAQVEKLEAGDQSIHGAYEEWQRWQKLQELNSPVEWDEIREQTDYVCFQVNEIFSKTEDKLRKESSWMENTKILVDKWDAEYHGSQYDQAIYSSAYLVDKHGYGSTSDMFEESTSLIERKPPADQLERMYWETGHNVGTIAVLLGVTQQLVLFWFWEEDIPLRKDRVPGVPADAESSAEEDDSGGEDVPEEALVDLDEIE